MKFVCYLVLFFCPISIFGQEEPVFTGDIQSKTRLSVSSRVWGKLSWLTENGAFVKKGDIVAKLESQDVVERLDSIKDSLKKLEDEKENLLKQFKEVGDDADIQVQQITLERDLALVNFKLAQQGVYGIESARFDVNIHNADLDFKKQKIDLENSRLLFEKGLEQEQVFQDKKINLKVTENNLELEKIKRSIEENSKKLNLEKKEVELKIAEVKLKNSVKNKEHKLQKIKFDIEKKEEAIVNTRDSLRKEQARLESHEVRTNVEGIARYREKDGVFLQVGDRIMRGHAVIDITYENKRKVDIDIEEKYILKYKIGQKMSVLIKETQEVAEGYITAISSNPLDLNEKMGAVARRLSGLSGITVFEVEVTFDDPELKYTPGLSVEVRNAK